MIWFKLYWTCIWIVLMTFSFSCPPFLVELGLRLSRLKVKLAACGRLKRREKFRTMVAVLQSPRTDWHLSQIISAGKNLSDSNIWICPIRKNRVRTRIFCPNFQSGHFIFYISIVRTRFWPEFTLVRIVRPEKNRVSNINFSSEFSHYPNCPIRIWPESEFLPAL